MAKGFKAPFGGGSGGGGNLMKQVKLMQEQMQAAQAQLAVETVNASVGGGVVKVTMTGAQVCKAVEISPELLKDTDVVMLQDLVMSAVNTALDQSRDLAAKKMGPLTGGLSGLGF
jgi:DNA-binding YbaB/EbfC family protein